MSDLRTAAQQALEALENHTAIKHPQQITYRDSAIDALRAALAEPVQEPVAWIHTDPDKPTVKFLEWREDEPGYRGRWIKTPLYTAPPQRKPLTRKEALAIVDAQEAYRTTGLPMFYRDQVYNMIRAIERAHGIGGNA